MGSILDELHEQHKARQERIKRAAFKSITVAEPEPEPEEIISEPEQAIPQIDFTLSRKTPFDIILHELCEYYRIRHEDILSLRRMHNIANQRHMLAYLLYRMTVYTNPQIGSRINRDPTTVRYGIDKIINNIATRQTEIDELEARIRPLLAQRKLLLGK